MKAIISIILFLGFTSNSTIKKRFLPYSLVIAKADLIVEGEISNNSFYVYEYEFKVTEFLKGKSEKIITVDMWREWTCDKRIESPKNGQKLILFLTKRENGDYKIIHGSTGELFIRDNDSVETYMNSELPKLDELKIGIKMFLKAFEYIKDDNDYFKRRIEKSEIDIMCSENEFFNYLTKKIKIK